MLTESEKRWLERRKIYANVNRWSHFSCQWCEQLDLNKAREGFRTPCSASINGCPRVDMEGNDDDVEFESRVAAKLARQAMKYVCEKYPCRHGLPALGCMRDKTMLTGPYAVHCEDCFLREARLQVEEEMDGQS